MPSYTDFEFTRRFRDEMLRRTLDPVFGSYISPKQFDRTNYEVQRLNEFSNINLPDVDDNRDSDLVIPQTNNIYKPEEFFIVDQLNNLPRRANLQLYPYFTQSNDGLIGILTTERYENESELFKFAARHIRTERTGPVFSRIEQNLFTSTVGRVRIADALQGNTTTLINILKGKEPLVEGNNRITTARSLPGQAVDFLQTLAGLEFPFSEIPGDYLTNPRNPVNVRPTEATSATSRVWQDVSGIFGSVVGINRRPLPSRKPSDLFIEYMGSAQKNRLFDLLSLSKYAPNYTRTARSQQSTSLFNFPNLIAQGVNRFLGTEAPNGLAYIGDDRGNDVKNATTDLFSGRKILSNYYQTILFDSELSKLLQQRPLSEKGSVSGQLTWIGTKSENKLGELSTSTSEEKTKLNDSLSKNYNFREDSILNVTQQILDSQPNGGEGKNHVANVIDQTSRFFKDGDIKISKGSAIKYVANGRDVGVEYARVWTKDRPYYSLSDTMPFFKEPDNRRFYRTTQRPYRRTNVRRFDGSVMTDTWNLNVAPMSNGNKEFNNSSNILENPQTGQIQAKKYMLSIENLAWKTSNTDGFNVSDLPFCERGPNGGRVMWFPPYDLKVSEQNSATWDKNLFLGRPEPIYTYQGTERTGQLGFKIIVDHPSIMNLLVREHFKNMTDEQADDFIHAYFAGVKDIDFYSLIRTYRELDPSDIELIKRYLNEDKNTENLNKINQTKDPVITEQPNNGVNPEGKEETITDDFVLNFLRGSSASDPNSRELYSDEYSKILSSENLYSNALTEILTNVVANGTENDNLILFGKNKLDTTEINGAKLQVINGATQFYTQNNIVFGDLDNLLIKIKQELESKLIKNIEINIGSHTSDLSDVDPSINTSLRRTHSIIRYIISKISDVNETEVLKNLWTGFENLGGNSSNEKSKLSLDIPFKKMGYVNLDGFLKFVTYSYGKKSENDYDVDCSTKSYDNKNLLLYSPKSFGCRRSKVDVKYTKATNIQPQQPVNVQQPATSNVSNTTPSLQIMKRIVMKTLTECFYFKKLEETSPIQFNTLKEKLRYFHPAFHSMTPEGLNSRLTFLLQCVRPGETIPVKGLAENSNTNARNTSFGSAPICVLRVGDFYNSKVIIRDVNITFEDNVWDLNSDGIGVQPMIAQVQLQLNFIGGQGLERPVQRLQNALSSNFFANTEMYDERSISTATSIGGKTGDTFTKEFLESIDNNITENTNNKDKNGTQFKEGENLGTLSGTSLNYKELIDNLYASTETYFNSYQKTYEILLNDYGSDITKLLLHPDYRSIKQLDIETASSQTSIELFGLSSSNFDLGKSVNDFRNKLKQKYDDETLVKIFTLNEVLPTENANEVNTFLINQYQLNDKVDDVLSNLITEFETKIVDVENSRNKIIETIDKLNFILKNEFDIKFDISSSIKSTLTSFNKQDFYSNYEECINYIKKNSTKLYSDIDSNLDFKNLQINLEQSQRITAQVTKKIETDISQSIIENFSSYSEEIKRKIKKQLERFYRKNDVKKDDIKLSKFKNKKNDKNISYQIATQESITTTDEMKKLFSETNSVTTKLNFYKP
jgi:hypothetical protein